ncbi:MAG: AraC family transcriptional regulator [Bacilli bacterium]|nr:AraC family transcriptional regulator [Bacilli bacterium]
MYQMLIVDDEVHVVDRLVTTIPWSTVGIENVYKAYSGTEAVSLLNQFSIDIVLTDIQMPGMSGLELIAEINRKWKKTKCILLSGHSDFKYAKEAILQQTEDYLLKPVTEKDLLQTVQRVMEKLKFEWEEVISRQRIALTLKENIPLLKGNLLSDLLQGRKISQASLREKMQMFGLPEFHNEPFALMILRLEEHFLEYDFQSLSLMEYAIANIVEELFGKQFELWHTKDAHEYLVFVVKSKEESYSDEEMRIFERAASQLQIAVKNYLKGEISILVSRRGIFPTDLSLLYNSSVSAFRKSIGSGQELFMRVADDLVKMEIQSLQSIYEPPTLIHLLEAGRWQGVAEKLEQIFAELILKWADSQEHLLEVYFSISSAFAYIAHKNGRQLADLIGNDYDKWMEGIPFRTINQLHEWSKRTLVCLKDDMDHEAENIRLSTINEIRKFVDLNLAQDISLQAIADHIHMHPVYVSKIYKLETGDNLSDYVHLIRMEKATFLLKNSQEKIYEIAALLGYQRPHSFNHAFKKHYQITPQEYRDQNEGRTMK